MVANGDEDEAEKEDEEDEEDPEAGPEGRVRPQHGG
jgi:hypothetical protein